MANKSNEEKRSDYIVVGVGAAGSVLAAELSASGAQVLVIESGGPDDAPTIRPAAAPTGGLAACARHLRLPSGTRQRARRRWRADAGRGAAIARTCVAAGGAEGAARR